MPVRGPSVWLLAGLALLSAGLLVLSFAPFDHGWLAWIALVPLFWAWGQVTRPLHGALLGLLFGLAFFTGLHRYLLIFGALPTVLVGLLQALPVPLFAAVVVRLQRDQPAANRVLLYAAAWVLAEWLRANVGSLSLTYGQLGLTQHANLPLLQSASLAGVLGLSFLIAAVNASLAQTLGPRGAPACGPTCGGWLMLGLVGAVVLACHLGGALILHRATEPTEGLPVGVVQGAVATSTPVTPEDAERCRETYTRLTEALMQVHDHYAELTTGPRPELVVWPETALPVFLNQEPEYLAAPTRLAQTYGVWLLMGALQRGEWGEIFNNAWLFDDRGLPRGTYTKQDLVMFGEYVPFRDQLPLLARYPIRPFDFSPGGERHLLWAAEQPLGALICFEAIFPGPPREMVRKGARLLVFLTSDAWAEGTYERELHSHTAPFRAVETRRWLARAATEGVSGILSPRGEWVAYVPAGEPGAVSALLEPSSRITWYVRWGDWPLVILAVLILIGAARKPRNGSALARLDPPSPWPES